MGELFGRSGRDWLTATSTSHVPHTIAFALHLAFLTAYPIFNALGVPSIHEQGMYDRFRLSRLLCDLE
jgi:hypothetical protein